MLQWLEQTAVADWVAASAWGYPITLASHGVGMAIVVGLIVMMSLRVLGMFPGVPLEGMRRLLPYLWAAFAVNLVSGIGLFVADAERFFFAPVFIIKIVAIVIGLVMIVVLDQAAVKPAARAGSDAVMPAFAKPMAAASIVFWLGVVVLSGRLIAYLA